MSIDEAREILYQLWATEWGTTTAYVFGNEGSSDLDEGEDPFASVSVVEVGGGQRTLGGDGLRRFKRDILIVVALYVPKDAGMSQSGTLANAARDVFESKTTSQVYTNDARVIDVGISDDKWKRTNVEIDGWFEDTK